MRFPKSLLIVVSLLPIYAACSMTYLRSSGELAGMSVAPGVDAQLAPDPSITQEAVVQVYGARVATWHGYFGVHTWLATKRSGADHFTVHEVTQSALMKTGTCVLTHVRAPDEPWYGNAPELLQDMRGPGVDALITKIEAAVEHYPFANAYRIWPGPNSNTFVGSSRVDLQACKLEYSIVSPK